MRVVERRANMMSQSFLVVLSDLKRYSGSGFYTAHKRSGKSECQMIASKYFNISNAPANGPMMDTCNREVSNGTSCSCSCQERSSLLLHELMFRMQP
ncbi:hypothetical protein M405DRAFT_224023 [Rhizopogon salebrosus TDB-379]|nr:hypothetical protein M405DRAFT_224023 [Rhizopogon salebrosus TDB-379]